jgi:hypothetical protein
MVRFSVKLPLKDFSYLVRSLDQITKLGLFSILSMTLR